MKIIELYFRFAMICIIIGAVLSGLIILVGYMGHDADGLIYLGSAGLSLSFTNFVILYFLRKFIREVFK